MKARVAAIGIFISLSVEIAQAQSASATNSFSVTMTIEKTCQVTNPQTLTFSPTGLQNLLLASGTAVTGSTTFQVQCTNTTPYSIGLNGGANGGTTATRLMKSGSDTIGYKLCKDAACLNNWGNTSPTDTLEGQTADGTAKVHTVYGKVDTQNTPPKPGTYTDTVTITVTY